MLGTPDHSTRAPEVKLPKRCWGRASYGIDAVSPTRYKIYSNCSTFWRKWVRDVFEEKFETGNHQSKHSYWRKWAKRK